jgi:hypothetical protein
MTQSPKPKTFNFGNLAHYSQDIGLPEQSHDHRVIGECNDYSSTRSKVGEPFNPWKRFNFLPIPEAMARRKKLPAGAKLVFGRLCRYAGRDGRCWPAVETLAEEVGLGERQTQKHLRTLEQKGFIRTVKRFGADGSQTSNDYIFLWHQIFEDWEKEHPR